MSSVAALPFSAWPTGRKVAAGAFAVVGYAALACAAVYLAGVLFLVLNKANPKQAQFASIVHYWGLYADDAQLRKKLQLAIGVSGIGLLILLPAGLVAAARPRRALHGDARFASPAEVDRAGLTGGDGQPGILIGRHRGKFLSLPGQLSVMLSAPTRSGKGVGVVIPNLLNWPDSVVVLDIKGENYDITAGYRAAHGQAVYAFSPFDEDARSHRWNPLTAVRSSPLHRVGDLLTIGQVFFPNDGGGTSSEAFFNDQARNLFLGLGLVLLETPSLPRTIGEMLRQSSGKGRSLKDHLSGLITQRREEGNPAVGRVRRCPAAPAVELGEHAVQRGRHLQRAADDLRGCGGRCGHQRRRLPARGRAAPRMSVYVRIPPNRLANARPLLNLFFSQLVSLNTQHLPEQDPTLKVQCLLVNDEFTAMGRMGVITDCRGLPGRLQPAPADGGAGDVAARCGLRRQGSPHLRHQPRPADPLRAARTARRRRVQRHARHFTERATSRGRSRSFSGHGQAPSAATRASSAARCCCRRSSRNWAASAWW
jgi:type IV secretion system protein VirD4